MITPLSPATAPRQAKNTRATCRGIVDRSIANPPAHKRLAGEYILDVFGGPAFLAKSSNHLGLRGYVLDTILGAMYDVIKPLVFTRIRKYVSAGACVARMISPPRRHTAESQS